MRRHIAVAILAVLATAACGTDPVRPAAPEVAAAAVEAKKKRTPQCSDYRVIVAHLSSLVDRQTTGVVREILLADLARAYAAMDPAACDARAATAHLQQFIADVEANWASIDPLLASALVTIARSVIGYIAPFVV